MCVLLIYSHLLLPPHAVSGPDCAGLLPAVVALAVALLTVLLLLVAAVFTAILFYTSESLHYDYCIDSVCVSVCVCECECTCVVHDEAHKDVL